MILESETHDLQSLVTIKENIHDCKKENIFSSFVRMYIPKAINISSIGF